MDKNREGYLGSQWSQHWPGLPAQGYSTRERSPCNFWQQKQMGLGWQKKLQNSQETSLKGPTRDLVLTQTYCLWYSAPGATAGKAEEAYEEKGRKVKWLVRGWVLGRQLPPGQSPEARQCHCPLIGPSPHRATKQQNGLLCPGDYLRLHPTQFTGDFSTIGHDTKTGIQNSST